MLHGITLLLILAGASLGTPAYGEVVVVVSSQSSVQVLTKREVANIFLGRQTRFSSGERAVPLDQEEGSPFRDEFYTSMVGMSAAQLKAHWSRILFTGRGKPPRTLPSGIAIRMALESDPLAIGYIDRSLADDSVRVLAPQ